VTMLGKYDWKLQPSDRNSMYTRKILKMCSHCLFPVVNKSGTSCYYLVTRLVRPTNSQRLVRTSLISSARNKRLTSSMNL
jgi:hypothetical protein